MLYVESIRRKPVSPKVYQAVTVVGLALFLILTAIVTFIDITRLIA